jgi:hypothetical protein
VKVSLVVGTLLALINYSDKMFSQSLAPIDGVRIALTYLVPFSVSTWASVQAIRRVDGRDN